MTPARKLRPAVLHGRTWGERAGLRSHARGARSALAAPALFPQDAVVGEHLGDPTRAIAIARVGLSVSVTRAAAGEAAS